MEYYNVELVYKETSSTAFLEKAILMLMENGICKIFSQDSSKATIMSALYVFSQERVASALASLCNNEIITIDFQSKQASFTPMFAHLLQLLKRESSVGFTKEEMKELIDNCTFKWTTQNGTTGRLVTGKNGNTIFFPANGYYLGISYYKNALCGYYWSANGETLVPNSASFFLKLSNEKYLIDWFTRYYGYGVRPVSD